MVGEMNSAFCTSKAGMIKWIAITFTAIIIGVVEPLKYNWSGYGYILGEAAFCLASTALILILITFKFPWPTQNEILFNLLCAVLNAAAFGCAVYACVELTSGSWRDRMAAVSAFSGASALVYLYVASAARQVYSELS